jgi:hypothetical protein
MTQRTIILIVILAVLFGVGGYFLYTKFLTEEVVLSLNVSKPIETNFETKIFTDQRFLDLKQNIELPIKVGSKGKANPFMPF